VPVGKRGTKSMWADPIELIHVSLCIAIVAVSEEQIGEQRIVESRIVEQRIVEPRIVEPRIVEPCPLMEGEGSTLKVLGFNHRQRSMFVHVLMRYL
jgi:chromodomain-helicase-DNA-binding protein 4